MTRGSSVVPAWSSGSRQKLRRFFRYFTLFAVEEGMVRTIHHNIEGVHLLTIPYYCTSNYFATRLHRF